MTPAEQIAAEVSARYGLPVSPAVVKVLPYRVPVEPDCYYDEKTGHLVNKEKGRDTFKRKVHAQALEARNASARRSYIHASQQKALEREAELREWIGNGVTGEQLAARIKTTVKYAMKYARRHNLPIIKQKKAPTPQHIVKARREQVQTMLSEGMARSAIRKALGMSETQMTRDLEALGMLA